ncbi:MULTISPECIES: hemerythrin family protein [unclassified Clostridium]|uniref:bacteriohemerythrin n=1 Tax=unclassified Clostridium TaxID=2614128 RepID=UPI0002977157|nr:MULTISPECIES: hemerythrin family protein [unclassified Clostridium]EKQ57539.1 MAG: hemerythrin-like metal-binding domain-containing protein [Clostridium sp. Maddingley MBC34-26]
MNKIEWNENLSIGNYAIDEQHKELINLINDVVEVLKQKEYTFSNLLNVVYRLDEYVENHLIYEEILMDKVFYPGKAEHVRQHDVARKKIDEINVFEEESFEERFLMDTLVWLVNWLVNHIMNTDKLLEQYL